MQNFFEWFKGQSFDSNKPWLVFGKGPSFAKHNNYNLDEFYKLGVNNSVEHLPVEVDIVFLLDLEVIERYADIIDKKAKFIAMPYVPFCKCLPNKQNLSSLIINTSIFKKWDAENRLLWFDTHHTFGGVKKPTLVELPRRVHNFIFGNQPYAFYNFKRALSILKKRFLSKAPAYPAVTIVQGSGDGAINMLATAGVSPVYSLGIDGGSNQYSSEFTDPILDYTAYAKLFEGINYTIKTTGVQYLPLQ